MLWAIFDCFLGTLVTFFGVAVVIDPATDEKHKTICGYLVIFGIILVAQGVQIRLAVQ